MVAAVAVCRERKDHRGRENERGRPYSAHVPAPVTRGPALPGSDEPGRRSEGRQRAHPREGRHEGALTEPEDFRVEPKLTAMPAHRELPSPTSGRVLRRMLRGVGTGSRSCASGRSDDPGGDWSSLSPSFAREVIRDSCTDSSRAGDPAGRRSEGQAEEVPTAVRHGLLHALRARRARHARSGGVLRSAGHFLAGPARRGVHRSVHAADVRGREHVHRGGWPVRVGQARLRTRSRRNGSGRLLGLQPVLGRGIAGVHRQ